VEQWQAELIGRIVGKIDEHLAGRLSLARLVEDARGLFDAADVSDNLVRWEFESVWAPVSGEMELRAASWSRPEWIDGNRLNAMIADLRSWAVAQSDLENSD
jgi:hypothetical protein